MNTTRIHSVLLILLLQSLSARGDIYGLWIPNGLDITTEGNSHSALPFNFRNTTNFTTYDGPIHYQQVYAGSQFTNVPGGGEYIVAVSLRTDCSFSSGFSVTTHFEVRASTTSKAPDELSPILQENVGSDEVVTFQTNSFGFGHVYPGSCPQTHALDQYIPFGIPFLYDPAKGNLLIDIRHSGFKTEHGSSNADAQNTVGDGISRIAAFSLTAATADIVDTEGLVTVFTLKPTPSLTITIQTNNLDLVWPTDPDVFRLEWAQLLGEKIAWQEYTNTIRRDDVIKELKIPRTSDFLKAPKYFRLYWNSPQPGVPGAAGATPRPSPRNV